MNNISVTVFLPVPTATNEAAPHLFFPHFQLATPIFPLALSLIA